MLPVFCLHLSLSLLTPPLIFLIHPSLTLSWPGTPPPASVSHALSLFRSDSVARTPVGPSPPQKTVKPTPQLASDSHLRPPALPPSSPSPTALVWAASAVSFLHRPPAADHVWVSAWNIQSHLDTFLQRRSGWKSVSRNHTEQHSLPASSNMCLFFTEHLKSEISFYSFKR